MIIQQSLLLLELKLRIHCRFRCDIFLWWWRKKWTRIELITKCTYRRQAKFSFFFCTKGVRSSRISHFSVKRQYMNTRIIQIIDFWEENEVLKYTFLGTLTIIKGFKNLFVTHLWKKINFFTLVLVLFGRFTTT